MPQGPVFKSAQITLHTHENTFTHHIMVPFQVIYTPTLDFLFTLKTWSLETSERYAYLRIRKIIKVQVNVSPFSPTHKFFILISNISKSSLRQKNRSSVRSFITENKTSKHCIESNNFEYFNRAFKLNWNLLRNERLRFSDKRDDCRAVI